MTSIGKPRAAHTLLKFKPAAMTAIKTSPSPGVGTSIASIWNALIGSPNRFERMTCASIRFGTSPTGGSEPIGNTSDINSISQSDTVGQLVVLGVNCSIP